VKQTVKRLVCWALQQELAVKIKLGALSRSRALTILNLHRVNDNRESCASISSSLFDELLPWLKQRFSLVGFDELSRLPASDKPPMIISFDDGYKDFVDIAVPILEKHRVRVNQNVVPASIESGRPPLNVILQDFIHTAPAALLLEVPLPGLPNGADPDNRTKSCLRCSTVFKSQPIAEQKAQFLRLQPQIERLDNFRPSPMMTIEEVRQLAGSHQFGAHSFEHATMAAESDDYLGDDVRKCREYFLERLNFAPSVYAFPNGSYRAGQPEIVHAAGFALVLLGEGRYSRLDAWRHYRFNFHADSQMEARARALGWPSFFAR
jgi:peptidoglycan/xylan/chitin deacetylase (PgdA/CDA1 family)